MTENAGMQKDQLDSFARQLMGMTQLNEDKFNALRQAMEYQLSTLRKDNTDKLEQMSAASSAASRRRPDDAA